MLRRATQWMVEAVYPSICAGCGRRGVWVCDRCLARHGPMSGPLCEGCGLPVTLPCMCRNLPMEIDRYRAAFVYDSWVQAAVHRFKYQDEPARGRSFAAAMRPAIQAFAPLDALVPVSLHPRRRRERGYDQALVLAEELSRLTGIPVNCCLERTRDTAPQVGQGHADRRENVRAAFTLRMNHGLRIGCRVALIDDVRTTGATLGECAAVLLPLRPEFIGAVTYAAAVPGVPARSGGP